MFQFKVELFVVFNRIPSICRTQIDDVDKHLGALNVPQKLMSQACTFVGTFYQSRDVSEDEILFPINADNP